MKDFQTCDTCKQGYAINFTGKACYRVEIGCRMATNHGICSLCMRLNSTFDYGLFDKTCQDNIKNNMPGCKIYDTSDTTKKKCKTCHDIYFGLIANACSA